MSFDLSRDVGLKRKQMQKYRLVGCLSSIILTYGILFTEQPFSPKFDQSYETVSVVVGKRALLPCYVSLQESKNNGFAPFKVIISPKTEAERM